MARIALVAAAALLAREAAADEAPANLRGSEADADAEDIKRGILMGDFVLQKRFNLSAPPKEEFDVVVIPDANLTHSCSNYTDDGKTVFSRDGHLVLKVDSHCEGGGCMNSGRVMSKESFKYGLFTFSATVPKCNSIWPALWLLPNNTHGEGSYGRWPCSGEIDVLETVHDLSFGNFNLVAGYGSTTGCNQAGTTCNRCIPDYCTSTTMNPMKTDDRYFVEEVDCSSGSASWQEHRFVLNWQPDELSVWIDPSLTFDSRGRLTQVTPKAKPANSQGMPTWKTYKRESTPTWKAVGSFMEQCFPEDAHPDAPFDDGFKIVLNIAVGGYGGAPCTWGSDTCQTTCGGAVGSELVLSDISVWELAANSEIFMP